jgi:hypothetical protein
MTLIFGLFIVDTYVTLGSDKKDFEKMTGLRNACVESGNIRNTYVPHVFNPFSRMLTVYIHTTVFAYVYCNTTVYTSQKHVVCMSPRTRPSPVTLSRSGPNNDFISFSISPCLFSTQRNRILLSEGVYVE